MPALGAMIAYEFRERRKVSDFMPPFVSMNYGSDQVKEGCLDSRYTPLNLDTQGGDFAFVVPEGERGRFRRRTDYLKVMESLALGAGNKDRLPVEELDAYRNQALVMMQSPQIAKILTLDSEEKKRYGSSPFGDACILTRNILAADAGTRFIAIHQGSWDFHTNIYDKAQNWNHYNLSRELDSGLGELIGDLEKTQTRDGPSLLDQTLIVCMGEFGRTPGDITVNKGRDHHRFAMSGLFAGGGIAGGQAIGATDEQGAKVVKPGWSKKRSIYPEDVAATIYSALGIDWSKEITNTPSGRAFRYVETQSGTDFLDVGEISPVFG
ncbi:MAG: hypothetical protein DMG27_16315 [Acidobacteria bacterium]|nr:MAG: hypothetical protein DMG27_16315 [Acidobacteriota bacterium]